MVKNKDNMKLEIEKGSENYAATIVEIQSIYDIPGADKIKRTNVLGNDVVVGLDTKVGDKYLYFCSGTKLSPEYCRFNNLLTDKEQNRDKTVSGYISHKQFRVKAIKLKSVISDGILLPLSSIWALDNVNLVEFKVGDTFTTINGFKLCEKYIVPSARNSNPGGKAPKQPQRISRLVEGQFYLHNDTDNLRRNMHKINPEDIIGIHYKKHGSSFVAGNVLVKKELTWLERLAKKLGIKVTDTEYDIVYSSRKVVKNQYLNAEAGSGYYGEDIWGVVAKEVGHLIPKNWTLYGEIMGYTPSGSPIQGKYDYGCQVGQHKFYVYKISVVNPDGKVIYLTDKQIEDWCEKFGLRFKDTFIYCGTVFQHLTYLRREGIKFTEDNWRESYLKWLESTYNEKDCYMCVNKVPEEGIVLRVERLEQYEAYKLKSKRFLLMESDEQENNLVNLEDNQDDEQN